MKVFLGVGVLILIVVGLSVWGMNEDTSTGFDVTRTTYFYGEECPHCQRVAEFLAANNIAEKVAFEKLEVWHNMQNARQMNEAVKICQLSPQDVGVPMIFENGTCHVGEPDVMKFFKTKAGIQTE